MPRIDRFLAKVAPQPSGCWIWTAAKSPKGYGVFSKEGDPSRAEAAHRASFKMFYGPIPEGMLVCHTCDTPSCVHPRHLFLGTPADNTADMVKKWRTKSKLTPEKVIAIRNDPEPSRAVARKYGLTKGSVLNIRNRKTFAHVEAA